MLKYPVLLVICGAGASYDAVPKAKVKVRPPLAAQLFDDRPDFLQVLRERPAARSIVQRLRRVAPTGGAVEEALGEFMSHVGTSGDPAYKRDAIALRFYLRDVVARSAVAAEEKVASVTNYLWLVTEIHRSCGDQVAYVSFNYDTMLENAINSRFGGGIGSDFPSYMNGPVPVFKPHGSVNWVEIIPALAPPPPGNGYFYMHDSLADVAQFADFNSTGGVEIFNPQHKGHGRDAFYVPAIAVPVANKDAFVMPVEHVAAMTDALQRTTHILAIGWRGSELRFQEALRQHLPSKALPSLIVTKGSDRSAADETIQNLAYNLDPGAIQVAFDGLTSFTGTETLAEFAVASRS